MTSHALTCARCRQPTRPFPAAAIDGDMIFTAETPFRKRLAYRCTRCGKDFCAGCCHPPALVEAMMKPGAIGLPREMSTAFDGAACPECRGLVRPLGDDEVELKPEPVYEDKPTTPVQRVGAALLALLLLSIAAWCFMGGAWIRGAFWGVAGGAALWVVFSK